MVSQVIEGRMKKRITNLLSDDVVPCLSEINLTNTESWIDLLQNKKFEKGKLR